jgi:sugar diacid utilization regulator
LVGGVSYGLVPLPGSGHDGEERGVRIAEDFLDRVGARMRPVVAVGPVADDLAGLAHSRASIDRVLRVLRDGRGDRRVARLDDIQVESLLVEIADAAAGRGDGPTGALARLLDYDRRHNVDLVATLLAWLDAFGDVTAASAALFVHPNTFRYRLRRAAEIGQVDLTDPDQRFALMLQLRVFGPFPPGS